MPHVHIEREEVAYDAVVLAPVQPMKRICPPGIRVPLCGTVELDLEPSRERVVLVGRRARSRFRRHRTGPQLPNHSFPDVSVGTDIAQVDVFRRQTQVGRTETWIVTGDTIPVDELAVPGCGITRRLGPHPVGIDRSDPQDSAQGQPPHPSQFDRHAELFYRPMVHQAAILRTTSDRPGTGRRR